MWPVCLYFQHLAYHLTYRITRIEVTILNLSSEFNQFFTEKNPFRVDVVVHVCDPSTPGADIEECKFQG